MNLVVAFGKNAMKQTEDREVRTNDCFKNRPHAETIQ